MDSFIKKEGHQYLCLKKEIHGYSVVRTIGNSDYDERKLVDKKKMSGNWFDILINVEMDKKRQWFF